MRVDTGTPSKPDPADAAPVKDKKPTKDERPVDNKPVTRFG